MKPRDKSPLDTPYMPTPEQYVSSLPQQRLKRPVGKRIWRGLVIACLLVVGLAVVYGGYIAVNVAKVSTKPVDLSGLARDETGRTNILVLGVGDPGHAGEKLSDTIMVLSVDNQTKRVAQISVPRDLRVTIPGYGYNKINTANAFGGSDLATRTVSETLGIPIHYYIETDFSGLKQMVDAVGGVDVTVKTRLVDTEYPCDDNQYKACGLDIEPGLQHMDGTKALQYARCRKGTCGNDFGRAARQQEIMNLVREKVVKWDVLLNPAKLTPIIAALRNGVQTDMGAVQMAELAQAWQQAQLHQPVSLVLSTSPGGYLTDAPGTSDLLPTGGDFTDIQQRVRTIFNN